MMRVTRGPARVDTGMAAGVTDPKRAALTGAEAAAAERETPRAEAALGGSQRLSQRPMRSLSARMPAVAA
jgi:hypothetical protein